MITPTSGTPRAWLQIATTIQPDDAKKSTRSVMSVMLPPRRPARLREAYFAIALTVSSTVTAAAMSHPTQSAK